MISYQLFLNVYIVSVIESTKTCLSWVVCTCFSFIAGKEYGKGDSRYVL